jgi:hypothetical protein
MHVPLQPRFHPRTCCLSFAYLPVPYAAAGSMRGQALEIAQRVVDALAAMASDCGEPSPQKINLILKLTYVPHIKY